MRECVFGWGRFRAIYGGPIKGSSSVSSLSSQSERRNPNAASRIPNAASREIWPRKMWRQFRIRSLRKLGYHVALHPLNNRPICLRSTRKATIEAREMLQLIPLTEQQLEEHFGPVAPPPPGPQPLIEEQEHVLTIDPVQPLSAILAVEDVQNYLGNGMNVIRGHMATQNQTIERVMEQQRQLELTLENFRASMDNSFEMIRNRLPPN
ncbi:hypothetical protein M5689_008402 [Euphorbia peplus]|nr:hypothetical protein M5689_008396 [Euphorbia peplus]WCJ26597.1 hypothetical protein M5689_008402 [Euphorbia peplus]